MQSLSSSMAAQRPFGGIQRRPDRLLGALARRPADQALVLRPPDVEAQRVALPGVLVPVLERGLARGNARICAAQLSDAVLDAGSQALGFHARRIVPRSWRGLISVKG